MNSSLKFRGVYPANLTPFKEDYSLDEQALRSHLRDIIAVKGVAGLVSNGHAGEVTLLTGDEQQRILEIAAEEVNGRFPIIAGVINESTAGAVRMAKDAQKNGADAILLFPPFLFAGGGALDDELPFHFAASVAEAVDIPIVIFQFPVASGMGYTAKTLVRMAEEIPSVAAVKEGSNDIRRYEENVRALRLCSRQVAVLSTNNSWHYSCLAIDGDGMMSGSGCVIADLLVQLWEAFESKDYVKAQEINKRIFPVTQAFYAAPMLNMHNRMKVALQLLGRQTLAIPRPPLMPIKDDERERIKRALAESRLL